MESVSGIIVGQKSHDYALKLVRKGQLGARKWEKKVFEDEKIGYITYDNVIGLLELPEAYRREGLKLFLKSKGV